jgi:[ribosomal protein S5]-alanine N-acetyltransferase
LQEIRGITVSANMRVVRLAHRYGFIPIGKYSSPDWMVARGWNKTEWQLTKKSWETTATKNQQ